MNCAASRTLDTTSSHNQPLGHFLKSSISIYLNKCLPSGHPGSIPEDLIDNGAAFCRWQQANQRMHPGSNPTAVRPMLDHVGAEGGGNAL